MGDQQKSYLSDPRLIVTEDSSTPIHTVFAKVYTMNPNNKNFWLAASRAAVPVSFYFDKHRSVYRIISYDRNELVINSTLVGQMKFLKTSSTFGLWSDTKLRTIYGMGFQTSVQLEQFADWFEKVRQAAIILEQQLPLPAPALSAVSVSYGDAGPNLPQPPQYGDNGNNKNVRKSVKPRIQPPPCFNGYQNSPRPETVQIIDSTLDLRCGNNSNNGNSSHSHSHQYENSNNNNNNNRASTGMTQSSYGYCTDTNHNLDDQMAASQMAKLVLENLQFQRELLRVKQLEADLSCLKTQLNQLHESLEIKTRELSEEKIDKESWKKKCDSLETSVNEHEKTIKLKEEAISTLESQLETAAKNLSETKVQLDIQEEKISEMEKELTRLKDIESENEIIKTRLMQTQEELENGDKGWDLVDGVYNDLTGKIDELIEVQSRLKDAMPNSSAD